MRGATIGVAAAIAVLLATAAGAHAAGRCGSHPWCNTSLSPDARARLLLNALTQDERISLLAGDDPFGVSGSADSHTGTSDGVARLGLPNTYYSDGPVGPRQGQATTMPSPMGLAASFDPREAFRHGETVGNEVRSKGNDVVFAPTVNIMRTPLGGRTFEAYGEEPYLVGRMAVGWIKGAQSQGVIANVKHFAANNQEGAGAAPPGAPIGAAGQGSRFTVNAVVDERTLREVYLPQFEAAVKEANVGSVMCSYNRLNDRYACENRRLLTEILRREWGFKGFVLADYGAAHPGGTGPSLRNGLDFEPWPGWAYSPAEVRGTLAAGQASQADVDEHIRRVLRTLFAYGFFDRRGYRNDDHQIDKDGHARTARAIEESGITLLRNDGILPLDSRRLGSVAILGAAADSFKRGGGSAAVNPFFYTTPRQGIERRTDPGTRVRYDPGDDTDQAASVAKGANVAIVVVADTSTEGTDKPCLGLDCGASENRHQDELIEKVAAANPNTVVVMETGGPVLTPWRDKVRGLVEAWYPGVEGGNAIARVLFGDVDPGGRLPATFPQNEGDIPTAGDPEKYPGVAERVQYKEGVLVGYRWYDAKGIQPAFPFGFGLSYTRFAYSGLRVGPDMASARVRNVGSRTGSDVAQLYVGIPQPAADVVEPPRQLRSFQKLTLKPGESTVVRFPLDARSFSYWDTPAHDWVVAPGCHGIFVGGSSRELPLHGTLAPDALTGAAAAPSAHGLRFTFAGSDPVNVDVRRVARGNRVRGSTVVKRFGARPAPFAWGGRRVPDGWYVARMRARGAARRFALERRHGRFVARPRFERGPSCDLIRSFKLGRPVFGGDRETPLRISVRVSDPARVSVSVRRGRRVVRRFRTRRVRGGRRIVRGRVSAAVLRRGRYTIRVTARRGKTVARAVLSARRL